MSIHTILAKLYHDHIHFDAELLTWPGPFSMQLILFDNHLVPYPFLQKKKKKELTMYLPHHAIC